MSEKFNTYQHKKSGKECWIVTPIPMYINVFFPDNLGEEGGDDPQTIMFNTKKFFQEYELATIKDEKGINERNKI